MTKTLKDFLEVYKPKSPDEQKFVDKHVVIKHKDRNGNDDDVFKGNTKTIKRKEERHGYDAGEDEKVYEALKGDQHKIDANKNGKVDAHDFKLLRKKKVAEEAENVEEARIYTDDYEVTSEKSQFGGHRPKVVHKEKGHTMFLGQHAYKKPATAVKHGEAYLSAYATRGDNAAQNASFDFARANKKHLYVKEDIDAVLDEALDLLMSIDEKTLTPAEMKKREEVVKAIKRDDPKMDKSMAYAIATKTAKRVAEGTMPTADEPTDANKKTAQRIRDLLAKEKKPVKEDVDDLDEASKPGYFRVSIPNKATKYHNADNAMHARELAQKSYDNPPAEVAARRADTHKSLDFSKASVRRLSDKVNLKSKFSKEEVEQVDESAKIAAHLIKRYGDNVRKSHVRSAANDFGVDASKLAKAVRTKLGKTSLAEEEQKSPAEHYKADLPNILKDIRGKKKSHSDLRREYGGSWKRLANSTASEHGHNYNRSHLLAVGKQHMDQHMQEEVQIDEISAATKDSYVKKAVPQLGGLFKKSGQDADAARKYYNRKNTVRKIANEEAEGLDELSVAKLKDYRTKARADAYDADDVDDERRYRKRAAGSNTAGKKIVRQGGSLRVEEAEGLDELSKKTLGSYVKKASGAERPKNPMNPKSVPITTVAAYQGDSETGHFGKRFNQATYDKAERLRKNRETGIKTAVNKLTKEEIEMIEAKMAGVAPGSMEGEKHMCATKVFHKEWNEGTPIKTMHADPDAEGLIEWYDVMFDHGIERVMTEDMEVLQAESHMHSKKKIKEEVGKVHSTYADERHRGTGYLYRVSHDGQITSSGNYRHDKKFKTPEKAAEYLEKQGFTKQFHEEVAQIDELSKKTLGSYTYQAASQLGSRGITTGLKIANDEPTEKNFKKMGNRQKGVATAIKKLTKEDIINRTIEKYVPEDLKFTPEERLLKRINGLSEAHVSTILGLFEALNKDNQNKMIETVETREGINQILNFVLENRGN